MNNKNRKYIKKHYKLKEPGFNMNQSNLDILNNLRNKIINKKDKK